MSQETPASTTEAQIKNKRRISPFWLLPFIALMIAGWLIWDSYQDRGNTVTIDFMSADGIVPGRTPVRYQGVEVGTVQDISLSDDLRKIEVKVSIKSDMKDALREETQFWLVTPKLTVRRNCFWRHQPELSLFAQRIFHIGLDADLDFNLTKIVAEADILHCSDFNALITNRRTARDNTIRRHKVDGDGITPVLITVPNQPTGNH